MAAAEGNSRRGIAVGDCTAVCAAVCGWLLAPAVAFKLRDGVRPAWSWVEVLPTCGQRWKPELEAVERGVHWSYRAHPWLDGSCLPRALTQLALHRLAGQKEPQLRIGARSDHEMHAWIAVGSEPLDGFEVLR